MRPPSLPNGNRVASGPRGGWSAPAGARRRRSLGGQGGQFLRVDIFSLFGPQTGLVWGVPISWEGFAFLRPTERKMRTGSSSHVDGKVPQVGKRCHGGAPNTEWNAFPLPCETEPITPIVLRTAAAGFVVTSKFSGSFTLLNARQCMDSHGSNWLNGCHRVGRVPTDKFRCSTPRRGLGICLYWMACRVDSGIGGRCILGFFPVFL